MKRIKTLILASSFLLLHSQTTLAQSRLIVVKDQGGTSTTSYYDELGLTAEPQKSPDMSYSLPLNIDDSFILPVRSTLMSVGNVSYRPIDAPGLTPIFLIGADPTSIEWLQKRHIELVQMRAVGLLIQVETQQDLQHIRSLAPELQIVPVNGNDFAKRLNLQHYPVLITSDYIEQ